MVILIIIYIISIIGAILSIRYDIFDEDSWTIFLVFCPALNSVVAVYELGKFLSYINDRFLSKFNKPLIKLIKYKRK